MYHVLAAWRCACKLQLHFVGPRLALECRSFCRASISTGSCQSRPQWTQTPWRRVKESSEASSCCPPICGRRLTPSLLIRVRISERPLLHLLRPQQLEKRCCMDPPKVFDCDYVLCAAQSSTRR